MTQQEIQELAGHRFVPSWVVKLINDCFAKESERFEQEPVAWMFQHDETGRMTFVETQQIEWEWEKNNPRYTKIGPLYTHPQPKVGQEPVALKKGECWPEEVMKQWDYWRKEIANGHTGSAPRDWFEGLSELKLIDTHPQPKQPLTDEIPKGVLLAISNAGLTLLKTQHGYELRNIGPAVAHGIKGEA